MTTTNAKERYAEMHENYFPVIGALQDVRFYGLRIVTATTGFAFTHSELAATGSASFEHDYSQIEELQVEAIEPYEEALISYLRMMKTSTHHEREDFTTWIMDAGDRLKSVSLKIIELKEKNIGGTEVLKAKKEYMAAEKEFLEEIENAIDHEYADMEVMKTEIDASIRKAFITIQLASLAAFLTAIAFGVTIARNLSRPIIRLKDAALAVGRGRLNTKVTINSKDEIGVLANAFNEMAATLSDTTVSKDYVENIFRSMKDSLIVLDESGKINKINHATAKMLSYSENELIARSPDIIIKNSVLLNSILSDLPHNASARNIETHYHAKNGEMIPVTLSAALIHDSDNSNRGMVFVAQDITERLRQQDSLARKTRDLERSNKELDKFAYIVSHDLKAPLRAISHLSRWIEEDIADTITADTRKQLNLLRSRVNRMENLINGILEYSRIGRMSDELERVDTKEMINEIIDSLSLPEGFKVSLDTELPVLSARKIQLSQVFSNLISNAIKHNDRKDGTLRISAKDNDDFSEFTLKDNGPGIAPEYHEKIFVIFQTLKARDKAENTGIGLSMVKKIVEEQGGQIRVESEEGKGSAFIFTWPKNAREE